MITQETKNTAPSRTFDIVKEVILSLLLQVVKTETREDYQDHELCFSLLCQATIDAIRILNLSSSEHLVDLMGKMLSSWPMIGIHFFFLVT